MWWPLKSSRECPGLESGSRPLVQVEEGQLSSEKPLQCRGCLVLSHSSHDPGWQIGDTLNWMVKKLLLPHNGSNRRVIAVYCNTQTVPLTRMMGGCSPALLLAKDLTNMLCKLRRSNRENIYNTPSPHPQPPFPFRGRLRMLSPLYIIQGSIFWLRSSIVVPMAGRSLYQLTNVDKEGCLTQEQWVREQTGKLMEPAIFLWRRRSKRTPYVTAYQVQ